MVLDYFKLREQPFGVTPDARFLFLSSTHKEALGSLLYGIDEGCGFLALIASPGLGKTTLLFHALHQLREKALTVFLFQTVCTSIDLLRALLACLGVQETQGSLIQLQSRLKEVLVAQARLGKRVVVVIDEAQNLDDSVLELIRMLSNFETPREKLIQIILSGQLELAEKIASPDLEQLRQRVSIFSELTPFSREDTQLYIDHRLRVAGYTFAGPLFTRDALALIAEASHGIPRNINNLCFNALSLAYALQRKPIDSEIIRAVIADRDLGRFRKRTSLDLHSGASGQHALPASSSSEARIFPIQRMDAEIRVCSYGYPRLECDPCRRPLVGGQQGRDTRAESASACRSNSFRFVAAGVACCFQSPLAGCWGIVRGVAPCKHSERQARRDAARDMCRKFRTMQSRSSAGDSPPQSSNEQSRSHRAWSDDSTTAFRRQFRADRRSFHPGEQP